MALCVVCGQTGAKRCSRCRTEAYCSRECQASDWKRHKATCTPPAKGKQIPSSSEHAFSTTTSAHAMLGIPETYKVLYISHLGQKVPCFFKLGEYHDPPRTLIMLYYKDPELAEDDEPVPLAMLTANLPQCPLGPDEVFVKTWSENEGWTHEVLEQCSELFEDTGRRQDTGYTSASVWRIKGDLTAVSGKEEPKDCSIM